MDREAGAVHKSGQQSEKNSVKENVAVADHLTFAYPGSDPIFKEISFTAKPGQIVGITGRWRAENLHWERVFSANIRMRVI